MSDQRDFQALPTDAFLKLEREEAAAHLGEVRRRNLWPDSDRLHGAWWDQHQESLNQFVADQSEYASASPQVETSASQSGMLAGGRTLALVGIGGAFVCGLIGLNGLNDGTMGGVGWLLTAYFMGSLGGLGVLFWVAGSIEQRLIEIRDRLAEKSNLVS